MRTAARALTPFCTTKNQFHPLPAAERHPPDSIPNHTFTANPIACASAVASLRLFEEEPVFERIAAIEATYARRLPELLELPEVDSVRWLGSIGVVQLRASEGGYYDPVGPALGALVCALAGDFSSSRPAAVA